VSAMRHIGVRHECFPRNLDSHFRAELHFRSMKAPIVTTFFIVMSGFLSCAGCSSATPAAPSQAARTLSPASASFDITFFVMADSHADPVPQYDLQAQARAINAVARSGVWPESLDGMRTGFAGGRIARPLGVVILGDLTGWGTAPTEIP